MASIPHEYLTVEKNVLASTQNQALNALLSVSKSFEAAF
jgi:hypothetical protein